ncbi:hypothetical protein [Sphingomonas sp. UNC305MFCol5.2]|uniref:hypothetical protein n=1 Tax=Sphingomonas sp. UNC305MFCol5.2 TaxID=1449076 RepID=UPI000411775B|nr:hypothetical protein [Sphingomonas sp. UNC305MFCol5.2]
MALKEIRDALGIERVIWVDDVFGEPEEDLALLASGQPGLQEAFPEFAAAFALQGFGDVDAALRQAVRDLNDDRRDELRIALLQADAEDAPAHELGRGTIAAACKKLNVSKGDRWTFEDADGKLGEGAGDDANVAYVIDLKEAGGQDRRGLDIVKLLRAHGSKGLAFILTHEAAAVGESALEGQLTDELGEAARMAPPITVISKERLTEDGANIETALSIALKRAGLRRALYYVLQDASQRGAEAYATTATALLGIDPERLEQYVYRRGRIEGVSELSVVERALSAGASKAMRTFFGTDAAVLRAMQTLRELQSIALDQKALDAGPILSDLRNAEIWENGELINGALTPLANGDVFKFDNAEPDGPKSPRLFVLLGQPCDITLRANGKRASEIAMLVPLIEVNEEGAPPADPNEAAEDESDKDPEMPFRLKGKRLKLNLRQLAYVRSAILDLACFRADGCVRVEAQHVPAAGLLAGARSIYPGRTSAADAALAAPMPPPVAAGAIVTIDDRLLLTMSNDKPWDKIRVGTRLAAYQPPPGHHLGALPDRVTWFLRREGRIRAPYSAFLLERALRMLGRRAFDSDFTTDIH